MIRDMEGLIPHGVGVILIVSSIVVVAMAFAAFIVSLWSNRSLRPPQCAGELCDRSDIPSAGEIEEFVRSLTPEDFAAAEKFAADFRRANGRSGS